MRCLAVSKKTVRKNHFFVKNHQTWHGNCSLSHNAHRHLFFYQILIRGEGLIPRQTFGLNSAARLLIFPSGILSGFYSLRAGISPIQFSPQIIFSQNQGGMW
jgi:hypothetical protein